MSPSKYNFSDFLVIYLKFRVYLTFVSLFRVMKDNSFIFLYLKPCILWTKRSHRKEIFRLSTG